MASSSSIGKLLISIDTDKRGAKALISTLNQVSVSADKVRSNFKNLTSVIQGPLNKAFNTMKVSLAAIAGGATLVGSSFEQSVKTVQAITGETAENMRKLSDEARRLGSTTAFTASQASDAMIILARSGMKAEEILNTTASTILFAGASASTLEASASLLVSTMRQFSLETRQAGIVSDIFAVSLKESLFDMQSLTAAMRYGGSVGSSFNMTLEETVAALAMFRNLGLEGSSAGTQFRMAMSKASKETDRGTRALERYGLTYEDINPEANSFLDIMKKIGKANMEMSDLITVFGVRSAGSLAKISEEVQDVNNEYVRLHAELMLAGGAASEAYSKMQNTVQQQFKILVSASEELGITLFENFSEPLKMALKSVSSFVADTAKMMDYLSEYIQPLFRDAFTKVGKTTEAAKVPFSRFIMSSQVLFANLIDLINTLTPLLMGFSLAAVKAFEAIIVAANGLSKIIVGLVSVIGKLFGLLSGSTATDSAVRNFENLTNSATLLAKVLMALLATKAVGALMVAFSRLRISLAQLRVNILLFNKSAQSATVGVTLLSRATKGFTSALALLGQGLLGIIGRIAVFIASFVALETLMENFGSEVDGVARRLEHLRQVFSDYEKTQLMNVSDILNPQNAQNVKNSIDLLSSSFSHLNDVTKESLSRTRELTTQQAEAGFKTGRLITVQKAQLSTLLSVRDALSIVGLEYDKIAKGASSSFNEQRKELAKLNSDLGKTTKTITNYTSLLSGLKTTGLTSSEIIDVQALVPTFDGSPEETKKAIAEIESTIKSLNTTQSNLTKIVKKTSRELGSQKAIAEELSEQITHSKERMKEATSTSDKFAKALEFLEEKQSNLSQQEFKDQEANLVKDAIAMADLGSATSSATTSLQEMKLLFDEFSNAASFFRTIYEGIMAQITKFETDEALKRERNKERIRKEGARKAKSLLEARLRLIEDINKRERDILAKTTEVEKNQLEDRLTKVRNHFKKELALYKNNQAMRRKLMGIQLQLEQKEIGIAVAKQMNTFAGLTEDIVGKRSEASKTEVQRIEEEARLQLDSLQKEKFSTQELLKIQERASKRRGRDAKKAQIELGSRVNSVRQLGGIQELQSKINIKAEQRAASIVNDTFTDSRALTKAREKQKQIEKEITASLRTEASIRQRIKVLEEEGGEDSQRELSVAKKHLEQAQKYQQQQKSLLKTQKEEVQQEIEKDKVRKTRAISQKVASMDVLELEDEINNSIKEQGSSRYVQADLLKEEQKRRLNINKLIEAGLSAEDANLLEEKLNLSKREVLQKEHSDAQLAIKVDRDKKIRELTEKELEEARSNTESLLNNTKSMYDLLVEQKDQAVSAAAQKDEQLAKDIEQIYAAAIPTAIEQSLSELINIYGDSTAQILDYERQLLESRKKTLSGSINDLYKSIKASTENLDVGESFLSLFRAETYTKPFNKFKEELESSFKKFMFSPEAQIRNFLQSSGESLLEFSNIIPSVRQTNERLIEIEINTSKRLVELRKQRKELEEKFGDLEAKGLTTAAEKYKILIEKNKKEEEEVVEESERKKIDAILQGVVETTKLIKNYGQTVINFYKKIFGTLQKFASIGAQAFSSLTGFTFNFSSALSDVLSKMDEAKQKQEEIQRGVVEGRFSPEQQEAAERGLAVDPASIATEYIDELIEQSIKFIDVLAEAAPALLQRLGERLPELVEKLSLTLPILVRGLVDALPTLIAGLVNTAQGFIEAILENLPKLIEGIVPILAQALPKIVDLLITYLPMIATELLNAVVTVLPLLFKGFIELLPTLIQIGIDALIQLIPTIINALVFELIPKLPEIALALVVGIVKGIGVLFLSLIKALGDFLGLDTSGLSDAINGITGSQSAYDAPTGFYNGINYVPNRMMAELHQGEAVLPADVNARRLAGQSPNNPAYAGSEAIGARSASSTPQQIDIAVMAEGRLLDAVQVVAMDRGHAPKLKKRFQRASGVKVGFSRGKFSKYN